MVGSRFQSVVPEASPPRWRSGAGRPSHRLGTHLSGRAFPVRHGRSRGRGGRERMGLASGERLVSHTGVRARAEALSQALCAADRTGLGPPMMDVASLIQTYGYGAIAAGTFLEGETVLLAAGAAAARGYLWLPMIIAVAAFFGFLGDQIFFLLGRRYGRDLVAHFPSLQPKVARISALLERHDAPLILAIRFLYGLRTV